MNPNTHSLLLIIGAATVCASACSRTDEDSNLAAIERCVNSSSTAHVRDTTTKSLMQSAKLGADQFMASWVKRWNLDFVAVFEGMEDRGDDIVLTYKKDYQGKRIRDHHPNMALVYIKKTGTTCLGSLLSTHADTPAFLNADRDYMIGNIYARVSP